MRAANIVRKLGGRMHGDYGMACCPAHEDRSPSLSIRDGAGGRILAKCHGGCEYHQVIAALRRRLGAWQDRATDPLTLTEAEGERLRQEAERKRERARRDAFVSQTWKRTWAGAVPARGSPIEGWLRHRGIEPARLDLDHLPLRWAPRCPVGSKTAPAMVALMTDPVTGRLAGIHRTFLLPDGDGKANVEKVRMMLGRAGVIRLSPDDEVTTGLGIAEGIETAMAIMGAGWRPVWACGSLGAQREFPILPGIECLTIFAEPKPHEIAGAQACAARWAEAGREVIIRISQGGDWNDLLKVAA